MHIHAGRFAFPLAALLMLAAGGLGSVHAQQTTPTPAPAAPGADASAPSEPLALSTPLPTDPRLVMGELQNGMRYVVLRHPNPPGRAALWLHVSTGSLNETDAQRGIAHYLEHMAFNGSENFPPGTVINFFQGLGLSFGQHQNAFTSFDQTSYQLFLPNNNPETIQQGLTFFSDVMGRLLLRPEEIEAERQVIMEEKRSRSGPSQRVQEQILPRLFPGATVGHRLPIGVEETILGMQRQDFVDYYTSWYIPSNMAMIVVADSEEAPIVEQIKATMGFGERQPAPVDRPTNITPYTSDFAVIAQDAELTSASIGLTGIGEPRPPVTTVGEMRRELLDQIASSAFARRIADKLSAGGTAYTSAGVSASNLFNAAFLRSVSADADPTKWREALEELGEDVQRARLHGFSEREIDDVRRELISQAERFVEQEGTFPARALISRINTALNQGEPVMSAQQTLDLMRAVLPTISASEVSAVFRETYEPRNVAFTLELPSSVTAPSEAELVEIGRAAFSVTPAPLADQDRASEFMTTPPTPGNVASETFHEGSDVATITFENGVVLHHRFMDIRKDSATISINLAGGEIADTADTRGVASAASLAWGQQATRTLSSSDIRTLMIGKKVNVGGGVGLDTMSMIVTGNPAELEPGMQLAHLLLTQPKIEASALERWKVESKQAIEARPKTPEGVRSELLPRLIYGETQPRFYPLTIEQVEGVTLEEAQAWLDSAIATAPIEVSVVGDISRERAVELVARYVGSLPTRSASMTPDLMKELRVVERPQGPRTIRRAVPTQTDQAFVLSGFYGPDARNLPDSRAMQLASRILSTRMITTIREEKALVYSIGASSRPADAMPGFGLFVSASTTDKAKVDALVETIDEMYREFAQNGPTQEELEVARRQIANNLDEQMREPGFWSGRLGTLTYRGFTPDDVMSTPEAMQTITREQVQETFARYFTPESSMTLIVEPELQTQ